MNPIRLSVMGAMSSLVALPTAGAAGAATPPLPRAQSYADLLQPIPNAAEKLRAADSATLQPAVATPGDAKLVPAAYRYVWERRRVYYRTYRRPRYRRHYYYYGYRYYAPPVIPYLYYRHHHHHHHHHHHGYF